jgi:hypothetical protein
MKKMHASGFIEELTTTDKTLGIAGFLAAFSFNRWFHNGDSLKERVRNLEKQHEAVLERVSNLQLRREEDSQRMKELDTYMHNSIHDLKNLIHVKSLKESIIDDIADKMNIILKKLEK